MVNFLRKICHASLTIRMSFTKENSSCQIIEWCHVSLAKETSEQYRKCNDRKFHANVKFLNNITKVMNDVPLF